MKVLKKLFCLLMCYITFLMPLNQVNGFNDLNNNQVSTKKIVLNTTDDIIIWKNPSPHWYVRVLRYFVNSLVRSAIFIVAYQVSLTAFKKFKTYVFNNYDINIDDILNQHH